jgi:hypothetical protein
MKKARFYGLNHVASRGLPLRKYKKAAPFFYGLYDLLANRPSAVWAMAFDPDRLQGLPQPANKGFSSKFIGGYQDGVGLV